MRACGTLTAMTAIALLLGVVTAGAFASCGDAVAREDRREAAVEATGLEEYSPDQGRQALHHLRPAARRSPLVDSLLRKVGPRFQRYYFYDPSVGDTLRFNLFSPSPVEPGRIYPLVLYLPDASAVGRQGTRGFGNSMGALAWCSAEVQGPTPCYVLVPEFTMMGVKGKWQVSPEVDMTARLVKTILDNWQIDTGRVYVTGQSMGGMMAMYLASRYRGMFAAALFVACDWERASYPELLDRPFVYVAARGDKPSHDGQLAMQRVIDVRGGGYAASRWSAALSVPMQDTLAIQLLRHGDKFNFITLDDLEGNAHRESFDRAYALTPILQWVMKQQTNDF